ARQLVADRFMDQHGCDCGIDAPRQAADHAPRADLLADFFNRLLLEGTHGPVALEAGNLAYEVAQDRCPVRRVHHLQVELRGIKFALVIADDRDRRIWWRAEDMEALRQLRHAITMAHPHRIFFALAPDALEEW